MADNTPDLSTLAQQALDVRDIERQITESMNEQNSALEQMVGFQKTLRTGLFQRLERERNLGREVKNIEQQLQRQRQITSKQTDDAKREESRLVEEGLSQRLTAYSKELEMLQKVNAAAIGPILYFLGETFKLFQSMDKAAMNFRKTMGFVRDTARDIRNNAEGIAIQFMDIGVGIEDAYNSFIALSKTMGSVHTVSKELAQTTAVMKAQLGVSEDVTAGFLRNMAAIAKSSMDAQKGMGYMAGALSNAAGVPLGKVMEDVASRSENTLTMMSRIPAQVIRSAVELRKMGTELDRVASSSRKILDFSTSVNAEMEASVLLGHSINLQRARELAYRRDLEGSTKEILKLTKSISFENLDVFQQEAFARATGKSVDELLGLVQAEKQWEAARTSSDPSMRARVEAYEKLRNANASIQKDQARQLEMMVLTRSNQERMTAISQKWQSILAKAGEVLLPVIDNLLSIVPPMIEVGMVLVNWGSAIWTFGKGMEFAGLALSKMFSGSLKLFEIFVGIQRFGGAIVRFVGAILSPFARIGALLGTWAPMVFKFISPFLKILGPIGWIITAFQFIGNLFKRLNGIGEAFKGGIINGILFGLKAIGGAVYDTLLKPFVDAWNWIKGIFVGKSPSTLGLGIVKGIISIQTMLFDAITYPWRHAFAWIADKIPGMGKVAEKLRGGFGGIANSIESKMTGTNIAPSNVQGTPNTNAAPGQAAPAPATAEVAAASADNTKLLTSILESINMLNKNLESGKIGFYVDGQLLSATLARQTEFRGGYGVNKVS
jgi:hypothetical protein